MDLLNYGMKNQNSSSVVKRTVAKGALQAAKLQADLYEQYIEHKQIAVPEDPKGAEDMLHRILNAVQ